MLVVLLSHGRQVSAHRLLALDRLAGLLRPRDQLGKRRQQRLPLLGVRLQARPASTRHIKRQNVVTTCINTSRQASTRRHDLRQHVTRDLR